MREAFNSITLDPAGLDRLGLDDNLAQAEGLIDATLLQGGWVSAHTFGWTEFDIDQETQALTVTTWGIDAYTTEEVLADPTSITDLTPRIVSQFVVNPEEPQPNLVEATDGRDRLAGTDGVVDQFVFEGGDSSFFSRDEIRDFAAGDLIDVTAFGFTEIGEGRQFPLEEGNLRVIDYAGNFTGLFGTTDAGDIGVRVYGDIQDVLDGLMI